MNEQTQFSNYARTINLITLALTSLLSAWIWWILPAGAHIPTHWNVAGEIDAYANKEFALLIAPTLLLILVLAFSYFPQFDPRKQNLRRSQRTYSITWGLLAIWFSILHFITIWSALGKTINVSTILTFLAGIFLMIIGNYQGKIRSNFMIGFRTPWTLKSEQAWKKTNRLSGFLFFILGLFVFLSGFLHNGPLAFSILMIGLIGVIIFLSFYSYKIWKNETVSIQ